MPHHSHMGSKRITVVETSAFTRRVEKLLSAKEREALEDYLAAIPDDVDVEAIRKNLDVRAVQDWEQKRRRQDRAARAYLTVIAKNPAAVDAALHTA
jgi:putative transcriptional regulator